jgi:hypothetical protein
MNPVAKLVILLAALAACQCICSGQQSATRAELTSPLAPARIATPPKFKHETFTFVRVQYSGRAVGGRSISGWKTDYPDADVNFTARFQQETMLKCESDGRVMTLTDPGLSRFPFIYITEGGRLRFNDAEVLALRNYFTKGGFLLFDDFWGDDEWKNVEGEIKRVLPGREIVDIPRTDHLFHCFFDIPNDTNLQVPAIDQAIRSQITGVTWEESFARRYELGREAHIRGIRDANGRLCVVFCHNTDLGDGWEREGVSEYFVREFSLKRAYPLGINIVVYALTQ